MSKKELDVGAMTLEEMNNALTDLLRTYYERMLLDFGEQVAGSIIDGNEDVPMELKLDEVGKAVIMAQALARGRYEYLSDDFSWDGVKEMVMGDLSQAVEMGMNKRGKTIAIEVEKNEDGGGTAKLTAEDLEDE